MTAVLYIVILGDCTQQSDLIYGVDLCNISKTHDCVFETEVLFLET